jgi:hypothetical protein
MSFALSQTTLWPDTTAATHRIDFKIGRCFLFGLAPEENIGYGSKILGVTELTLGALLKLL